MRFRESQILIIALVLSMAGIGLATFLVANHYQYVGAEICSVGPFFNCDKVNRGNYSTIPEGGNGIPWSVIGLAGFVVIFALAYLKLYYPQLDKRNRFIVYMLMFSVVGVVFVVYLNYLELAVIHQICLLCAISHIIMIVILFVVTWWFFIGKNRVGDGSDTTDATEVSQ